jgi:hypothetical protein
MPDLIGNDRYDNGCLSGVLDEVMLLLSNDNGGMQLVASATVLSCSQDAFVCARH